MKENAAVRGAFYDEDFPATTSVQMPRLRVQGHVIEHAAIAIFPE